MSLFFEHLFSNLRHTFGESKDLPDEGTKKDQIILFLTGLDKVDFASSGRDMKTCLEGLQSGTAQIMDESERQHDRSRCAAESKDLGW